MDKNQAGNMKPIKVLEVIRQGEIGGGESHLIDLVQGFRKAEIEAVVLAFTPGPMIETMNRMGIKCYVVETSYPFDIRVLRAIKHIIETESIQLIHAHGSRAASNLVFLARRYRIPFIYTVHGWSFHPDQPKATFKLRALSEKLICSLSQKVICVSESNKMTGMQTFGLKKATVIENGINLRRFNPENPFQDIRPELGFQKDDFVIGLIARLTTQKAPLDFLRSVVSAHRRYPRIKALLVGDGDLKEEVLRYIQAQKAEDYISVQPFRQDVPDLLNALDIFCLPSLWEGLSIALLEAMAMGKALVVTPTDGTGELIVSETNGLVVPFSSPEKLAEAYLTYFEHPALIQQYGQAARQVVRKRFDSERVSDEVARIYHILLKS